MALHVVVIGAGISGVCSAIELLRDGHRVTLLDPGDPGGEQAASFGNGGWLSPGSVLPVSHPGIWREVPGYLADPLGPLAIRWRYLPQLAPWLWRFVRAGSSMAKVAAAARALRPLVADSPARHVRLAAEAGVAALIRRSGLLYVFPSREDFVSEVEYWRIRQAVGLRWIELDANDLHQREPALDRRYAFGVLVEEGGHCTDPGALVAGLARQVEALGGQRERLRAIGFDFESGRLRGVRTDEGVIAADRAVIAAGARSRTLAEAVGDRVSLETERGYHAVIAAPEAAPRMPLSPFDGKMIYTPMAGGLRIAGQVELGGLDAAPDWRRAEILRQHALQTFPDLPRDLPAERVSVWMGHRPSTPDGLPCLGRGRCRDVVHAYGHGHIGLMAGPISGRLVADLITGGPPTIDPAPYAPGRFARG
jgi:D-amino-acid dehydrogenase